MRAFVASLAVLLLVGTAHAKPTVSVTTCGQAVPPKTIGLLAADLDCTGFTGGIADAAVSLDRGATLDLQGHTLTGALFGVACYFACEDGSGACSNHNKCLVTNGTVTGAEASGITGARVTIRNVTSTGNGDMGVQGEVVRVIDSTLNGNGSSGASGDKVRVEGSTINDNVYRGVRPGRSNANGHYSGGMSAKSSTILGNGTAPDCGPPGPQCGDISTPTRPHVKHVTCGRSVDSRGGKRAQLCATDSWCICLND